MRSIKGHFDGTAVVLDEPAMLAVGQAVSVIVDPMFDANADANADARPPSLRAIANGTFEQSFSPHADPAAALMHGEPFDERDALHIDPLDAVPSDFVRQPGSGAGEIKMADDFDETPDEFKEYL